MRDASKWKLVTGEEIIEDYMKRYDCNYHQALDYMEEDLKDVRQNIDLQEEMDNRRSSDIERGREPRYPS